jgi:hypothetical protein
MNTLKILSILILVIASLSCNTDDDNSTVTPASNGITIEGDFTAADQAFIIFDRTAPYDDGFFLVLANGELINDTNNEVFAATNTTIAAALLIDNTGQVATQDAVNVNVSNYVLEKGDTVVVENISNFTDVVTQNGTLYGEIDQDSAVNYLIENSGSGSLDITAISKNFTTRDGTISFTFSITDDNGVLITGSYTGSFKMLNGDT